MKKNLLLSQLLTVTFFVNAQNVGIGTPTPLTKLHVFNGASGATPFAFSPLVVENNGHTYINLLSPAANEGAILFGQPGSSANGVIMYNNTSTPNGFQFRNNGNITRMAILNNGNIGINTITPSEKLHVTGNIKADTVKPNALKLTPNAGAGKILTSDAAGNANWQTNNASAAGNIGYGVWGDCATNGNISEYNPVADATGAAGDLFGYSVSVSGNFAIVGSTQDVVAGNANQGSASIYQYNGTSWVLMQKITDPTGTAFDRFGISVSISGNFAIVGAYTDQVGANPSQGSACIYFYDGSMWIFMQKLTDPTGTGSDNFGTSVAISGNYAVIGSPFGDAFLVNQGTASVFWYNGSSWVFTQKLSDPLSGTGPGQEIFGQSVSISGNYIIVGAPKGYVGSNVVQGYANIYQYNGSSWVLMQKLTDPIGAAFDYFGWSVSVSGNYVIVGVGYDEGSFNSEQGAASIYQYNGSSWVWMQDLMDPGGVSADCFGRRVAISGNYAIVGAARDDIGANTDQGAASIYFRIGLGWQKLQYITDPGGNPNDLFGGATAIDGSTQRFLIGVSGYAGQSGKVVFGKVN